uniref:Kinetochore protein Spc24 n=1 Tax=Auxenochlorella protothecoides TaxID=3075 RepID=A0A1D2A4V4_AUXPR
MNTGDVFDEHLGVIAALRDNYARHDDTDTIRELLGIQEELEGLLSSREDTVKQAIQGVLSSRRERSDTGQYAGMDYLWKQGPASLLHCSLTALSSRVEEARIKAVYPEEEGAHDARLRELEARVAASKQHVAQLTTELEALGKQRQQLGSSMKEVGLKKAQVDHLLLEDEPRIRHQLSLYAHVSKISWRFDNPDRIAGTVSDPEKADVRLFDLAPQMPRFEATNQLWRLMEAAS